jgi:hypothetical protein
VSAAEGYEYNIQYRWIGESAIVGDDAWHYSYTNKFSSQAWYHSEKSVNNALAQLKAPRWGQKVDREYRIVRRPYGEVEVVG